MIDSKFAKAYTEVLEIIKYIPKEEYDKIPISKIEFYKENMDKDYIFKLDSKEDLSKQNISLEANAVIINLYLNYFASDEQKLKIKQILNYNQKKLEEDKKEKYNIDDLFKQSEIKEIRNVNSSFESNTNNSSIVEYKETFMIKFRKFILKILHINTD